MNQKVEMAFGINLHLADISNSNGWLDEDILTLQGP